MINQIMSESIDQLATALAKAQAEMSVAYKNQKNPFFKSKYADFEAIIEASRPSLSKHGLSVAQSPMISDHDSFLVTVLMHSSGQWIKSVAKHNPPKNDVQSLSSYNTYLKRMCYASLVGVATADDDDGEAAVHHTRQEPNPSYNQRNSSNRSASHQDDDLISKDQLDHLEGILEAHPDVLKTAVTALNIDNLSLMPKDKFLGSLSSIQRIIANKGK